MVSFFVKKNYVVNVENNPRLWYTIWRSFDPSFLGFNVCNSSCQYYLILIFFPFIPNSQLQMENAPKFVYELL
jgi:hypothetical protein